MDENIHVVSPSIDLAAFTATQEHSVRLPEIDTVSRVFIDELNLSLMSDEIVVTQDIKQ